MAAAKFPTIERCAPTEPAAPPLVRVVDDEGAIQGLFRSLGRISGFEVATYGTAADLLANLDEGRPGCLVVDLCLPDRTGIEVLQELAARQCPLPVVFMSGTARVSEAVRALKLGSLDFVEKPFELATMVDSLRRAISIDVDRRRAAVATGELEQRFVRLTDREIEVMDLIVAGAANKEVAARLGLSPKTVEIHRANVMRKTRSGSLAELVRLHLARQNGRPVPAGTT
jgi:two-component system response regulator FixJ